MQISGSELDGVDDGFDCDMEWVTCACLITLGMQGIMWVLMHGGGCIVWVLTSLVSLKLLLQAKAPAILGRVDALPKAARQVASRI